MSIQFAGRSQSADVVSATGEELVVSLPGVQVPLKWSKVEPRHHHALARVYLPPDDAQARVRLGRYCLVHGLTDEAEEEFVAALRLDRTVSGDVRPALDYIRRREIEEAVASVASPSPSETSVPAARRGGKASSTPRTPRPRPGWEHPYMLFSRKDVPALAARFRGPGFSAKWSRLLANANAHLGGKPTTSGSQLGSSRDALGVAGTTAFAYAITGEAKYAERAKAEAFGLVSAPRWMAGKHAAIVKGADLVTGEASTACALVYDWCYSAMSEEERERLRDGILKLGVQPYLKSLESRDWWVDNLVTNWCGVCHGGCGLACLALYNESPDAKRGAETAFEYAQKFLRSSILEDGGGHEGVMYWRYGVEFGHYFFTAAERMFGTDGGLYDDEVGKLAGYWDVYMHGPDLKYANFNDMNEDTSAGLGSRSWEGGPQSPLNALFESKVPGGDPLLLWAADNGGAAYYWRRASPFGLLWRRPAPAAGEKPVLQDAVLFRGAGHAIWRSPRLWFAYNGGWISDKSHFNKDLGTFVLVVGGERFVNDPGYGKSETGHHSTILVDGKGQRKGSRATYLRYGSGKGFRYLASDMTDCYEGGLRKFVRHAVMVRGAYIVLVDDLAAPAPAQFEWRLQTRSKIELRPPGDARGEGAVLRGAAGSLCVIPASPKGATVSQGRAVIPFVRIRPAAPVPAAIVATVLYPAQNPASPPRVSFKAEGPTRATLTVAHPGGGKDELVFGEARGYLVLAKVNRESALKIGPPAERTIRPFRKGR